MNKAYRIIRNKATGLWMVVSETARGQSKGTASSNRRSTRRLRWIAAASVTGLLLANSATAESTQYGDDSSVKEGTWNIALRMEDRRTDNLGVTASMVTASPYAAAFGDNANATAFGSTAIGSHTTAEGTGSAALGTYAITKARMGLALGAGAYSEGLQAMSFGAFSVAIATRSMAIGALSTSTGVDATAIGTSARASGQRSIAIGAAGTDTTTADGNETTQNTTDNTVSSGTDSIALGTGARSTADGALAVGSGAQVVTNNGVALGSQSVASRTAGKGGSGLAAVSVGNSNATRQIVGLARGTQDTDAVNLAQLKGVVDALGGGAAVDADGKLVAPRYTVGGESFNTVGEALGEVDTRIKTNTDAIGSLTNQINSGAVGLVQQDADTRNLTIGKNVTGTEISVAGNDSDGNVIRRKLTGVANGTADTDAATVGQLKQANKYFQAHPNSGDAAVASGTNAVALGGHAVASGSQSIAQGLSAKASGEHAIAVGSLASADQSFALAVGQGAEASAEQTTSLGQGTKATAELATAVGAQANATAERATASGAFSMATGIRASAFGTDASASGRFSTALGNSANAEGLAGVAVGSGAAATKDNSVAMGRRAVADAANGIAIGSANVNLTTGEEIDPAANVTGEQGVALGTSSLASASKALALGAGAQASHEGSVALGAGSVAAGKTLSQDAYLVGGSAKGEVNVGNRRLTGLAAGAQDSDAANVAQLKAVEGKVGQLGDNAVQYDDSTKSAVTLNSGGKAVALKNVAEGTADTDAANYGQLKKVNQRVAALDDVAVKYDAKGNVVLGRNGDLSQVKNVADGTDETDAINVRQLKSSGMMNPDGSVASVVTYTSDTKDTVSFGGAKGTKLTNVAAGSEDMDAANYGQVKSVAQSVAALDNVAVKYDASGNVTLGQGTQPVQIKNVADGTDETDAVNVRQLKNAGMMNPDGSVASVVTYTSDTKDTVSFAGANGTKLTNVQNGSIASGSMDAVTGGQLYASNIAVAQTLGSGASVNASGMLTPPTYLVGGNSYNNVGDALGNLDSRVSNLEQNGVGGGNGSGLIDGQGDSGGSTTDASATGDHSTSVGSNATATSHGSTALGANSQANAEGSVALGKDSVANRENTVSVGSEGSERQITNVMAGTNDTDAVNVSQLNGVKSSVSDLKSSVDNLQRRVEQRFDQMDSRMNRLGAMNAAMSTMVASVAGLRTDNSVAIGTGLYRGQTALAIGYQRKIADRLSVTIGGATAGGTEYNVGVGVGYGW